MLTLSTVLLTTYAVIFIQLNLGKKPGIEDEYSDGKVECSKVK